MITCNLYAATGCAWRPLRQSQKLWTRPEVLGHYAQRSPTSGDYAVQAISTKKRRTQPWPMPTSGSACALLQRQTLSSPRRHTIIRRAMSIHLVEGASDGCRPKLHRWPFSLLHLMPRSISRRGLIFLSTAWILTKAPAVSACGRGVSEGGRYGTHAMLQERHNRDALAAPVPLSSNLAEL